MPEPTLPLDLTGRTIGDFVVVRKLGQGGMGQVYLARQQSLKRDVALKILKTELAANPTALLRFRAEAEAVARISHPNIVQVYAIGEQDGIHYMALEYVDGRNLRDYLARKGPPELPIALSIIRQVASALQRASELGIVHRDIKPENILVTRKVEVKVADFGLSRFFAGDPSDVHLTQSGVTLGTPLYMSPEQVQGQPTDHRSDIYSLGVTCYHLLAGEPPFTGRTAFEVTIQHVQSQPPSLAERRPDLPVDLCAMVHTMMAKRPEDRYQSARDIIRDVTRVRDGLAPGLTAQQLALSTSLMTGAAAVIPGSMNGPMIGSSPSQQALVGRSTLQFHPQRSWPTWLGPVLLSCVMLILAGGSFLAAANWPSRKPAAAPDPGLPTARPPERVVSTQEIKLRATIENRSTRPDDLLTAMIQLGLLYVQERRFADAEALYRELETVRGPGPGRPQDNLNIMVARFGKGIVRSHEDKPKESTDAFLEAMMLASRFQPIRELTKGGKDAKDRAINAAQAFFLNHPELSRAVAEAIQRNLENAPGVSCPPQLDWLRTPRSLVTGPKS